MENLPRASITLLSSSLWVSIGVIVPVGSLWSSLQTWGISIKSSLFHHHHHYCPFRHLRHPSARSFSSSWYSPHSSWPLQAFLLAILTSVLGQESKKHGGNKKGWKTPTVKGLGFWGVGGKRAEWRTRGKRRESGYSRREERLLELRKVVGAEKGGEGVTPPINFYWQWAAEPGAGAGAGPGDASDPAPPGDKEWGDREKNSLKKKGQKQVDLQLLQT